MQARIGDKFAKELIEIKDARLRNGNSKDRVATERLTNMMTKHEFWKKIKEDLVEASEEELNKHGE